MNALTAGIAGLVVAIAGTASASTFQYASDNVIGNQSGGQMDSVVTTFNPLTNQFTWSITFSNQVTEGFTLAVSPGENPKSNPGQLAMLYFDASDLGNVNVSAYGYNGLNSLSSFIDGDGSVAGQQDPDFISGTAGPLDGSWVLDASVVDGIDGSRTMSLTIDATDIQDHTPLYPDGDGEPWTGLAFGSKIGFWFHTFTDLQTAYDAEGRLTQWGYGQQGWSDRADLDTVVIPLPPAAWAGLVGLAGAAVMRRRLG